MDYFTPQIAIMIREKKMRKSMSKFTEIDYYKAVYHLIKIIKSRESVQEAVFFLSNRGIHPLTKKDEARVKTIIDEFEKER